MDTERYIERLGLEKHPEGGFFKETYRAAGIISASCLAPAFTGDRNFSTSIYFLLQQGDFSAFHRIKSDEGWHFYAGGPLVVHMIFADGRYEHVSLGNDLSAQQLFQFVVPANTWFASEPAPITS